ncbi:hypothetical protein F4778DRAFT_740795, partial [Xylariomycetidae sp. FL2044]
FFFFFLFVDVDFVMGLAHSATAKMCPALLACGPRNEVSMPLPTPPSSRGFIESITQDHSTRYVPSAGLGRLRRGRDLVSGL